MMKLQQLILLSKKIIKINQKLFLGVLVVNK